MACYPATNLLQLAGVQKVKPTVPLYKGAVLGSDSDPKNTTNPQNPRAFRSKNYHFWGLAYVFL